MTKRAPGKFARNPRDLYSTPFKAVPFLIPHIDRDVPYAEPMAGEWKLVGHLMRFHLHCGYAGDIGEGRDALEWQPSEGVGQIISNPPWTWALLKPLLAHLIATGLPVWLLLDADLMHNVRMRPFMDQCFRIVSVGRLKWIPDSAHQGLDNAAWYGFRADAVGYPQFVPREQGRVAA